MPFSAETTIALGPKVTSVRLTSVNSVTTNAKLHVSNQKSTKLPLKHSPLNGTFQALPIGEGVKSTWNGFQLPELKGGNSA